MALSPFLHDGYTEDVFIAGVPGMYQDVRCSVRPMLIEEVVQYSRSSGKLRDMDLRRYIAKWLAEKIRDWDIKDANGKPVQISEGNLLRLKPRLFSRLWVIVSGEEPGDTPPEGRSTEEAELLARDLLDAEEQDAKLAAIRQAREEKN